jgi:hypothetical protein
MRVVVCGSPSWNFDLVVQDEIVKLHRWCRLHGQKLLVIHGGENGPETVAEKTCIDLGIDRIVHPANRAYGDSAWPRRNQLMLQEHHVDLVLVFVYELNPGTMAHDMANRAKRRGVPLKLIDHEVITKRNSDSIEFNPFSGVS